MTTEVVALDSNVLINAIKAFDNEAAAASAIPGRCLALLHRLDEAGVSAVVPAPAYSEYLQGGNRPPTDEEAEVLEKYFRVAPLDAKAAVIAARVARDAKSDNRPDGATRQELKVDSLIIGAAVAVGATRLYTTDGPMQKRHVSGLAILGVPEYQEAQKLFADDGRPSES